MNSSAFMENLKQLFAECDKDQSGSLGPDEFKELCSKIGLSEDMADETFKRLDIDRNSQITFDEFAAGFQQYKQQTSTPATNTGSVPTRAPSSPQQQQAAQHKLSPSPVTARARSRASPNRPASSSGVAGGALSLGAGSTCSRSSSSTNLTASGRSTSSGTHPESVLSSSADMGASYEAPVAAPNGASGSSQASNVVVYSGDAIGSYDNEQASFSMSSAGSYNQMKTMQDLLECVQKLQNENQILTQIFFKDKRERDEYISQLGEEFDQQLREVEERANRRAREELEAEKKRLSELMQSERETLQHHYQTLEKISKIVKSSSSGGSAGAEDGENGILKVKNQLEDTFMENRQLKKSLMDTKTDVAMIWKEMEKLKKQYESKLSSAYEKQRETQHECDHIKLQLNLMKDSNKKLQDASDVITNYITDKVEPVIKVALDGENNPDDYNHEGGLSLRGLNNSASNSRRGSILSEYLNNNDAYDQDEGHSGGDLESMASSNGGHREVAKNSPPIPTSKLLKRMNGLETSLSRNQRFNQSTTSSSSNTTNNDLHLNVPTRASNSDTKKDRQGDTNVESHANNKLPVPILEQKQSQLKPSGLKSLGRTFLLGNRTQSEPKANELDVEKNQIKSASVDRADDPIVEPADGPSVATFNIILVGDSFVGKSSFAARFIEGNFVQGLISNCSIDFKTKTYKVDGANYTVNLWDTAGQERFRSITASYFRKADGIILMYDVTDKRSYLNVRNWMSTISDTAAENVAVLLVGNKIDLRTDNNRANCVPIEEGFRLAKEYDIVFLETSVKTGANLLPSMGKLIRLIAKNNTAKDEDSDRIRLSDKGRTFNCMPKNC